MKKTRKTQQSHNLFAVFWALLDPVLGQLAGLGTRSAKIACNNAKNLQSWSNEQCPGAGGKGRSP